MEHERRRSARFKASCKVTAKAISPEGVPSKVLELVEGEICNASQDGCCILAERCCPVSTPLECRIAIPNFPDGIPTLMEVRWTRTDPARGFAFGAQFLLG